MSCNTLECLRSYKVAFFIKQRHETCFMHFFIFSTTVDDSGSNVPNALSDKKYARMPLAHARPSTMWTTLFFAYNYCLVQTTNGRAHARCIGTLSGHNGTDRTQQEVNSSEPNDDTGKRTTWALGQNHLSCLCKSGWSSVVIIAMQDHPYLWHCSAAYIMHTCTLSMCFSDPCSRMIVRGQHTYCTLKLCCTFCSYTRLSQDEEGSSVSIIRRSIIKMFQIGPTINKDMHV